tara:strand:- start:9344 stop:9499 length:156 start_codon:yes stop_codon:yes gene_type:complete
MNIEDFTNLEDSGWGDEEIIKEIEIRCGLNNSDASRLYLKLKYQRYINEKA